MINKAVILCGGLATRFLPFSKSVPKEMLPILNKPILQLLIEDLHKAGITQVLIVTSRNKEAITKFFDRNVELENRLIETNKEYLLDSTYYAYKLVDVYIKQQGEVKGTGYGVKLAKNWVGNEPFIMTYGDEILFNNNKNVFEQLIDAYNRNKKTVIAVQKCPKDEVYKYGIIDYDKKIGKDYTVKRIIEKPKVEDAPNDISYIGPSVITSEIFDEIDKLKVKPNEEIVLTNAFDLLAQKNRVVACEIDGERHDLGNKLGFLKANIYAGLKDKDIKDDLKYYLMNLLFKNKY